MKADAAPLSSEQALDDYFSSLLGLEDDVDTEVLDAPLVEPEVQQQTEVQRQTEVDIAPEIVDHLSSDYPEQEVEAPKQQPQSQLQVAAASKQFVDCEQPDLAHLEKLFSGLQSQVASECEPMVKPEIVTELEQAETEPEIQNWDTDVTLEVEPEVKATPEVADIIKEQVAAHNEIPDVPQQWRNGERAEGFQVLYFDVNGVTFAVPLDELGGIHQMGELNHLIGKPSWYLGLQSSRENKLDVVDTARWVMPDVLSDNAHQDVYEYIVMLGESNWGLASSELKGTELLMPEAVRWREKAGKRPWLAGMVKQQMCALVHVSELIDMLNAGLDVKSVQ
ncbi:chemotaxis protein CheW [Vibrio hangzhouensis]|uniref:Purine-binding chemotaxis protein CheW n=1 Tax=Vibrio hangzhouensis TaxID=462991 RepID=A0A1H5ZDW0_9VIBR|nr:chemotaxis protein CheW [Vibrio hangzhouensis]SEG34461.1 purine-binding chemotaxis protein CheW [Vibrio hangzhouensis]